MGVRPGEECATGSHKTDACTTKGIHWKRCGSNTYPAGSFPGCRSALGVYDQHGNAAGHMNLPLAANQLASVPDGKLGETEMKGSWFIFARTEAHELVRRGRRVFFREEVRLRRSS